METPIWYVFGLWILWMLQFVLFRPKQKSTPIKTAPNFRWGIVLQALGNWAIFLPARTYWAQPIPLWRIFAGAAFGLFGIWLASSAVRHLGKQWQIKAAINDDHELVTSGPYQIIRHPIYASMFAMYHHERPLVGDAFPGGRSELRSSSRESRSVSTWKMLCYGAVSVHVLKSGR